MRDLTLAPSLPGARAPAKGTATSHHTFNKTWDIAAAQPSPLFVPKGAFGRQLKGQSFSNVAFPSNTALEAMSFLDRMTTKHTFPTGEKVSLLHRFALKLEVGDRFVEVGFEQAFEPGVERLIHEGSIRVWQTLQGDAPVTAAERSAVLERVVEYCNVKELTYRVVRSSGGAEHPPPIS